MAKIRGGLRVGIVLKSILVLIIVMNEKCALYVFLVRIL